MKPTRQTILIVHAITTTRIALTRGFEAALFRTVCTANAAEGLQLASAGRVDAIILSADLPDMDGRDACRVLRKRGLKMPILILKATGSDADHILALEAGANDYVTESATFAHLHARVRAHLRTFDTSTTAVIRLGRYVLQMANRLIVGEGVALRLTEKEAQMIKYLHRAQGVPVSKRELLAEVWGYSLTADTHTVETHVYRLRKKINQLRDVGYVLQTYELGYSWVPFDQPSAL